MIKLDWVAYETLSKLLLQEVWSNRHAADPDFLVVEDPMEETLGAILNEIAYDEDIEAAAAAWIIYDSAEQIAIEQGFDTEAVAHWAYSRVAELLDAA
jgi:hypothetical protein